MRRIYLDEFDPVSGLAVEEHIPATPKFKIIDMHSHFGPMLLGENYAEKYDAAEQVRLLKSCGIEKIATLELVWGDACARLAEKLEAGGGFFNIFPSVDVSAFEEPGFDSMIYKTLSEHRANGFNAIKLWKNITLSVCGKDGRRLRLDDARLKPVFAYAGELGLPIVIHVGDPLPFFAPIDAKNEYISCLTKHPEWSFCIEGAPSFEEHMEMQEKMLAENPKTTFVVAHVGSRAENLRQVSCWLDLYPNMYIDVAARIDQLGRQPYTALRFLEQYQDRILFGSDYDPTINPAHFYSIHYRFFETSDEYFDHPFAGFLGNWKIYGVSLSDSALEKIYRTNAERVLGL